MRNGLDQGDGGLVYSLLQSMRFWNADAHSRSRTHLKPVHRKRFRLDKLRKRPLLCSAMFLMFLWAFTLWNMGPRGADTLIVPESELVASNDGQPGGVARAGAEAAGSGATAKVLTENERTEKAAAIDKDSGLGKDDEEKAKIPAAEDPMVNAAPKGIADEVPARDAGAPKKDRIESGDATADKRQDSSSFAMSDPRNPKYRATYPQINPDDNLDKLLGTFGLRPLLKDNEMKFPEGSNTKFTHKFELNSYVGNRLPESEINNPQNSYYCAEATYAADGVDDFLETSDSIKINDPRLLSDLAAYVKKNGYDKWSGDDMDHWFRFSGSAVWLPHENKYLMVSRYFYADEKRNEPKYSIIRMQLFNPQWEEVYDQRLRYVDITEAEARDAFKKFAEVTDPAEKSKTLDQISIKLPTFLNVKFDTDNGLFMGPEDPRVLYRKTAGLDEPIVPFNMLIPDDHRKMQIAFPLRKPVDGHCVKVILKNGGDSLQYEKNWTPYFERDDIAEEVTSDNYGHMHFVYSLDRLFVLRCDLTEGTCENIFDTNERYLPDKFQVCDRSYPRGATNMVPLPRGIIQAVSGGESNDLQMWFAFGKTHVERTGCGLALYRPIMVVMAKLAGEYSMALYSDSTDLGMEVLGWEDDTTDCSEGPNVLTPNSIAFWALTSDTDYMDVTVSQGDREDRRVVIKGVSNYLLHVFESSKFGKKFTYAGQRSRMVANCISDSAFRYGMLYASRHKPLKTGDSPFNRSPVEEPVEEQKEEQEKAQ